MPEAQWDWHVGWALISVRFPRLRPPGCCGRGSTRSRSTARRRGQSVTVWTTAPRSGSRSWLISAHGNWLPRPKAQARRRKHPSGPPPAAGRTGTRAPGRGVLPLARGPGTHRRSRPVPAAGSRRILRGLPRPGPAAARAASLPAAPPGRTADATGPAGQARGRGSTRDPGVGGLDRLRRQPAEAPAPSSPVGTGRRTREFPAVLAAASQKPHNRYFQDLPDDVISDDTGCQQALQRRHLAVPPYHDRAEGTGTLDAAEPSGRAKITVCGWPDAESRETSGRPTRLSSRNCGQASRRK